MNRKNLLGAMLLAITLSAQLGARPWIPPWPKEPYIPPYFVSALVLPLRILIPGL